MLFCGQIFLSNSRSLIKFIKILRFQTCTVYARRVLSTKMAPIIDAHYDLIVIGGGSGGLAAAKEAVSYGAKVAVLDYVEPSPRGTKWGLGGTCVNVGCIPKKLMHIGSMLGDSITDVTSCFLLSSCNTNTFKTVYFEQRSKHYGWTIPDAIQHQWEVLREAVQGKIKSSNWLIRVELRDKKIDYINGHGIILDPNTVKTTVRNKDKWIKAKYILVAVGGRPNYPDIPGALEYGITSDDLFSLEKPPGKTLVVGAGYIGLECAGFLHGYGFDVTVLIRSIPLRGFDQQMANLVVDVMKGRGVKFHQHVVMDSISKQDDGKLLATWKETDIGKDGEHSDVFDTVLFAIGRRPLTSGIGLENTLVKLNAKNGKVIELANEQTHEPSIYAVGDVLDGKPELTPSAIHAARILARRLFANSKEVMNYSNVATTIFTPLEYSCVGLSEEAAIETYGSDNIEVYHTCYKPVELALEGFFDKCYLKVVALRHDDEKVLGLHFLGPDAGEVIQGFSAAMNCNLTMKVLKNTVGIHPTIAEEFTRVTITKRSGIDPTPQACCS